IPRTYKRKTNWGSMTIEEMKTAATDVMGGKAIRSMAKDRNIDRSTLRRWYSGTAEVKRVFTEEIERELANHVKKLADQFHGLTPKKCCELALELAQRNTIPVLNNWEEKGLAGSSFMARHHFFCHLPEATSLGRATAFSKTTVGKFFDHLANVMDR
uniref:Zgc:113274 n=1 Tax=Scleropages formosus TaxID=113540 RepID=A0A8C9RAW0_SCLFO